MDAERGGRRTVVREVLVVDYYVERVGDEAVGVESVGLDGDEEGALEVDLVLGELDSTDEGARARNTSPSRGCPVFLWWAGGRRGSRSYGMTERRKAYFGIR